MAVRGQEMPDPQGIHGAPWDQHGSPFLPVEMLAPEREGTAARGGAARRWLPLEAWPALGSHHSCPNPHTCLFTGGETEILMRFTCGDGSAGFDLARQLRCGDEWGSLGSKAAHAGGPGCEDKKEVGSAPSAWVPHEG